MSDRKLNVEQKKAVEHTDGPLLIVAGAGTGKTTVLIERLNYLIKNKLAEADEILITTFTEKAAGEMEERADRLLPIGYVDLWINTFHGFCERILRDHALDIGLPADFKLLSQTEQWMLVRKNLDRFDLDYYRPLGNPSKFVHELIRHFSRLKDENISAAEYLEHAENLELGMDSKLGGDKKARKSRIANLESQINSKLKNKNVMRDARCEICETDSIEAQRIKELANAYHVYNQLLLDSGFLDFGDLIFYAIKLFRERPNILKFYQNKFKYIMVDEFQDTNWSQYELIKILTKPKNNLVVVGDDDQCLPGENLVQTRGSQKRIDKIKIGDEVATAVGKGYLSFSKVIHVNRVKKKAKLITLKTKSGHEVTATDNHKMFCFIPPTQFKLKKNNNFKHVYYVYLMHNLDLGWRIGITDDLAIRLKLERSADRIVAINSFNTEEEARYYETLYSLKYSIPTACFKDRAGIMTRNEWSRKLYEDLDVNVGILKLAKDLGINLDAHQVCLDGVNRGNKVRIKINLEMCYRNYRSKYAKDFYLKSPKVEHLLSVETSHLPTLAKLKRLGLKIEKARKGGRMRLSSADLSNLGKLALKIQEITGGIIENKINVGTINIQYKKALIVPAGNLFPGMYIPIVMEKGVVYDQIIERREIYKNLTVYDLEIERTHNFIANGVVVHNSIYKFRGASLSNIMQFKDDFPKALEVVLSDNYRSGQVILDHAYEFISNNNPNRLEVKLGINKKLKSQKNTPFTKGGEGGIKKGEGTIEHLHFDTEEEEVEGVMKKMAEIYKSEKDIGWQDFAILVRANDTADKFVAALTRNNIPNQFVSLRGLYHKPIVLDIIAYLRLLDNYHESAALFRVLNMDVFKVSHADIISINKFAKRKVWSIFETLERVNAVPDVSPEGAASIGKLLSLIKTHSYLAQKEKTSKLYLNFIYDSGMLAGLDYNKNEIIFDYLNQFYQRIKKFEQSLPGARLKDFMEVIELEFEAGETGGLKMSFEDVDTVKIMTVHSAKGLEFKYVFVPDMVDKKFPVVSRSEKISIPDELVREKLPEGNLHIEEERRLFYVAMTRAKNGLFLASASDYGGEREKKISKFVEEAGVKQLTINNSQLTVKKDNGLVKDLEAIKKKKEDGEKQTKYKLPEKFSFSQLEAFSNCPLQYKFAFILKIPVPDKPSFIFGRVMHNTLRDALAPMLDESAMQQSLFGSSGKKGGKASAPSLDDLNKLFEKNWVDDGFHNKKEREEYKKKGKEIIKRFYEDMDANGWPGVMFLEKNFNLKINGYILKGAIDRIDRTDDKTAQIIDYKTGKPKEKLEADDKRQLILYKIAVEEVFGIKVSKLTYYYLENGEAVSFEAKDKEVEKVKEKIIEQIEKINQCDFSPKPGFLCQYCDFRGICEFRK